MPTLEARKIPNQQTNSMPQRNRKRKRKKNKPKVDGGK